MPRILSKINKIGIPALFWYSGGRYKQLYLDEHNFHRFVKLVPPSNHRPTHLCEQLFSSALFCICVAENVFSFVFLDSKGEFY